MKVRAEPVFRRRWPDARAGVGRLGRSPGYDPRFSSDKIGIVAFGGPSQLDGAREVLRDAGAEEVKDV